MHIHLHATHQALTPGNAPVGSLAAILQADVWGQSMVLTAEPDGAPRVLDHQFVLPHRARPYLFKAKYLQALFGTIFLDKAPMVAFLNVRRADIELSDGEKVLVVTFSLPRSRWLRCLLASCVLPKIFFLGLLKVF